MTDIIARQEEQYRRLTSSPLNIIFLDIDGVLNCQNTKQRSPKGYIGIDPVKAKILKEAVNENDAAVVLTSTWKRTWNRNSMEAMEDDARYMVKILADADIFISDKTEDSWDDRGNGIARWLKKHPYRGWVVLDDELFHDYKPCGITPHLIRTSYGANGGINVRHTTRAKKLFEEQESGKLNIRARVLTSVEEDFLHRFGFIHMGKE